MATGGICAACSNLRPLGELLAFWPVGDPERVRFVCRPSLPPKEFATTPCFARVVGATARHQTMLATDHQATLAAADTLVEKRAKRLRHGPSRGADLGEYATVLA